MNFRLYITLLMTLVIRSVYSQEGSLLNKHSIDFGFSYYTFYNHTPIIQMDTLFTPHSASRSLGIIYQYIKNERFSCLYSIDMCTFRNFTAVSQLVPGDVRNQNFLLFQGQCQYNIWKSKRSVLKGAFGISFRGGSAVVHVYFNDSGNGGSSLVVGKSYLDVGIPLALNYTHYLGNHFHLNARLIHTFFPYTYEKKTNYPWDTSPFRNMSTLTIGLGFNFGT